MQDITHRSAVLQLSDVRFACRCLLLGHVKGKSTGGSSEMKEGAVCVAPANFRAAMRLLVNT